MMFLRPWSRSFVWGFVLDVNDLQEAIDGGDHERDSEGGMKDYLQELEQDFDDQARLSAEVQHWFNQQILVSCV